MNHGKSKSKRRSRITWKRQQGLHTQQQSSNVCVCVCQTLLSSRYLPDTHRHTHTRTLSKQYKGIQFLPGQRRRRRSKSLPCRKIKITDGCCCCCAWCCCCCCCWMSICTGNQFYVQQTNRARKTHSKNKRRSSNNNNDNNSNSQRAEAASRNSQIQLHWEKLDDR